MIRRAAALLALVAFTGAWLVGVWSHEPPRARMVSAVMAALFGAVAGGAIGVALERIVLARLMEQWETASRAAAAAAKAASRKGARAPESSSESEGGGAADADGENDREPEPAADREPQDSLA